jgi:molybdopterin-containing oxidoreductase family membrane subunit
MEKLNPEIRNQIENELLKTVGRRYRQETFWVPFLALVCAGGTVAWIIQLRTGLGVTAMRDYVSWGLYISLLFFFVGVSLIGALISSVLRMSGAKWRYPLIRIAEAITLSAIFFAGFMPVLDMGRPERLFYLIIHARIQSPILWDVVAIFTYFIGSIIYFYLPLIPDLAIMRDKLTDAPKWRKILWRWMAMGWEDNLLQRRLLKKAMLILSIVILPVAISVHTISAWLIAFTLRPGWNSTIMGPYFVFGALMAGTAIMILIVAKLRHGYRLENYLTPKHFNHLAKILLALAAFYLYLNINKYGVPAFKMAKEEKAVLEDLFFGNNAILFWFTQVVGLVIPIIILSLKKMRQSIKWVVAASVLVLLGALINRYLIVVPNMLHPFVPIQHAEHGYASYIPTLIEWTITASSLAGFVLLIILLFKPFPVITMWEVTEEVEKRGEKEIGIEEFSNFKNLPGHESL